MGTDTDTDTDTEGGYSSFGKASRVIAFLKLWSLSLSNIPPPPAKHVKLNLQQQTMCMIQVYNAPRVILSMFIISLTISMYMCMYVW